MLARGEQPNRRAARAFSASASRTVLQAYRIANRDQISPPTQEENGQVKRIRDERGRLRMSISQGEIPAAHAVPTLRTFGYRVAHCAHRRDCYGSCLEPDYQDLGRIDFVRQS